MRGKKGEREYASDFSTGSAEQERRKPSDLLFCEDVPADVIQIESDGDMARYAKRFKGALAQRVLSDEDVDTNTIEMTLPNGEVLKAEEARQRFPGGPPVCTMRFKARIANSRGRNYHSAVFVGPATSRRAPRAIVQRL